MNPERWERVQELFHRAADLETGARQAFLVEQCGDDPALRAEVDALLRADALGAGTVDAFSRFEARVSASAEDPLVGTSLGAYCIRERLGSGGMGVVHRAERADGLFEQEVAIKWLRLEHVTQEAMRRFELERRTLATLLHPSIARLYDGGTAPDGRPYLVMELVEGEPIDRHCARRGLGREARLRLLVAVCRAVHFAHQNLVVHCDLKPANILVDANGLPHLLDFGIARLLGAAPGEDGGSAPCVQPLTPEYASPEQLRGRAVTTAHDVWSLGVVLHELLTGKRPFPRGELAFDEYRERVEREPVAAPSVEHELPALRGDLDAIVCKALAKDPAQRYASAGELADDLERHLAHFPVRARSSGLGTRLRCFVRRNVVAVGAGIAVFVALVTGLLFAVRGERRAATEARHASMEAVAFQNVASFLMDAFLPAHPTEDPAWAKRAEARIVAHAERVRREYPDAAHTRGNLLDALGQVALRLDLFAIARVVLEETKQMRVALYGPRSVEHAVSLRNLANLEFRTGRNVEAVRLLREALSIHRTSPAAPHADVAGLANDLAACLRNLGEVAEAEALHREALALRRAQTPKGLAVAESLNNLSGVLQARGERTAAIAAIEEALAIRAAVLGDAHTLTLQSMSNLAVCRFQEGQVAAARDLMRRAEVGYRAQGLDGEDELAVLLGNLATVCSAENELGAATVCLEEASAIQVRRLGADHPKVAATLGKLAVARHAAQREAEARAAWKEALRIRRLPGGGARELAETLHGYGVFCFDVGELAAAESLLGEAVALFRAEGQPPRAARGRALHVLARCKIRQRRHPDAKALLEEAVASFEAAPDALAGERERAAAALTELLARMRG